jgi:hypothetical protein
MGSRPFPEISCALCSKPVDLLIDLSADENGKAPFTRSATSGDSRVLRAILLLR